MSSHGGNDFAGNAKYLYLYISNNTGDEAIYLINDEQVLEELKENDYSAVVKDSIRAKWKTARAENVCITHGSGDVPWWFAGGANILNLWHGVPIKKIGIETDPMSLKKRYLYKDVVFATPDGDISAHRFKHSFNLNSSQVARTGYPRNEAIVSRFKDDHLGTNKQAYTQLSKFLEKYDESYIYVPTFRENRSPINDIPTAQLNQYLQGHNACLVIKAHPKDSGKIDSDSEHILQMEQRIDIYPFLDEFDLLITDYSSIHFDYMITDNPIIYFWNDIEEYQETRELFADSNSLTPGKKVETPDQLVTTINDTLIEDQFIDERAEVCNKVMGNPKGSCQRIYSLVK